MERNTEVEMLGENVAYTWTCDPEVPHDHVIDCLCIWHNCTRVLDPPADKHWTSLYTGWKPAGVGAHDLISVNPLHIEASVYWPACCGMHGWIRDGKWVDA